MKPTVPTDVLIDETQLLYGRAERFWQAVKKLKSHPDPKRLRIFMVAAYGEHSCTTDLAVMDISSILLRQSELDELVANYNKSSDGKLVPISESVKEVIQRMTGGHAGLTRRTMELILEEFRTLNTNFKDDDIFAFLVSQRFNSRIAATRAVPDTTSEKRLLSSNELEILEELMNSPRDCVVYPQVPKWQALCKVLVQEGFLTLIDTFITFASPLVRTVLITRHLSQHLQFNSGGKQDFEEFLEMTLSRMNGNLLKESLSKGDDGVWERQWQNEFYRAATTVLPATSFIFPDVRTYFKCPGFADYFVDSLGWVIELVREGEDMEEQERRFTSEGLYSKIAKHVKQWIILDFRNENKKVKELRPHFWHALYNSDFSHFTLQRFGHDDKIVKVVKVKSNIVASN